MSTTCHICGGPVIHTGHRNRRAPRILDAQPRAREPGYIYRPDGDPLLPGQIIDRTPGYRAHSCPPLEQPDLFEATA